MVTTFSTRTSLFSGFLHQPVESGNINFHADFFSHYSS